MQEQEKNPKPTYIELPPLLKQPSDPNMPKLSDPIMRKLSDPIMRKLSETEAEKDVPLNPIPQELSLIHI